MHGICDNTFKLLPRAPFAHRILLNISKAFLLNVLSLFYFLRLRQVSHVESEEEQTDSEDDEYMDDIELKPTQINKRDVRRESVSAEQVGANPVRFRPSLGMTRHPKRPVLAILHRRSFVSCALG